MALLTNDHLTRLSFSIYENRGVYAFLLGSGLSRAAQIPTGWEITLDLIRRVAMAQGEKEQVDWLAWYRNKAGKEPDYSELVAELGSSPEERRAILHSYIEPTAEDREHGRKIPTAAHFAIADLVKSGYVRVIISTNFDRLTESALRERGIEPTAVSSPDLLKGAEPLTHSSCYLLKLHGDYKDSRILNTGTELSAYPPEYDELLDRIFDEHGLVVCGWSGDWDHALRAAILRSPARRYSMYWTTRSEPSSGAQELISHRSGVLVSIADADTFLADVRNRVETLAQTHRQNPQSIKLLVNSTKRYVGKQEHRIALDDLLTSESHALIEKLNSAGLPAHSTMNAEEFQRRVAIYEAATEPLARMLGILGRWGEDNDISRVLDIIRYVHNRSNLERAGLSTWIYLQSYPAVLLVASYGLGLVHSQRWRAVRLFLSSDIENRLGTDPVRMVDELFPSSWDGGQDEHWTLLEGMDGHITPLSDHLCGHFENLGKSFLGVVSSFETLYETWEVIAMLVYSERYSAAQLQKAISTNDRLGSVSVPLGRSVWNGQVRNKILRNIRSKSVSHELLDAGFGEGQKEFLEAAIGNFERLSGRMR